MGRQALTAVVGATFLSTPLMVHAAPPVAYGGWSANTGNIDTTVSCSSPGVTCTTLVEDAGFIQQEVQTGGYTFIRAIVVEDDASGAAGTLPFSSESFIPFATSDAGLVQGVAARQIVRDDAQGFVSTAEIQRGFMKFANPGSGSSTGSVAADMFNVKLSQTIETEEMSSTFGYVNYTQFATSFAGGLGLPDSNEVIGQSLDISQRVTLTNDISPAMQGFEHRKREGYMGNSRFVFGGGWFVSAPLTDGGQITLANGTVAWDATQGVQTTWMVQDMDTSATSPGISGVAYQRAENLTTGANVSSLALTVPQPASPFDWDPDLDAEPTIP